VVVVVDLGVWHLGTYLTFSVFFRVVGYWIGINFFWQISSCHLAILPLTTLPTFPPSPEANF
jgi:hypothetical protein